MNDKRVLSPKFLKWCDGYVYLIHFPDRDCYKVGRTINVPKRLYALTWNFRERATIIHLIRTKRADLLEKHIHEHYAQYQISNQKIDKEYFRFPPEIVEEIKNIKSTLEDKD